jgi:hypothetical protein
MKFEPGKTYFGTLSCAHGDLPSGDTVTCAARSSRGAGLKPPRFTDGTFPQTNKPAGILTR